MANPALPGAKQNLENCKLDLHNSHMPLVERPVHKDRVERLLRSHPVVAILGARQVGKTTLAHQIAQGRRGQLHLFDLEDPRDLSTFADPMLTLEPLRGLVVLDEIQRLPGLFEVLRVLADRPRTPARFLLLGSASPELLRQSSESLAGRIAFHELGGFDLTEIANAPMTRLWQRGGFPDSYLARSNAGSAEWRRYFIRTLVSRDLPELGMQLPSATMGRFWSMLAHYHGQVLNTSELGRSFGVSHTTVRKYLDLLQSTFVVDLLPPWHANLGKRVVKSPKVYISDSGILHSLLDIESMHELERHPKLGASWEGFMLSQTVKRLGARKDQCFFFAIHAGIELDLLVTAGTRKLGFEFKRTSTPKVTKSMRSAMDLLALESLCLIHAGNRTFDLATDIKAIAAVDLLAAIAPLKS